MQMQPQFKIMLSKGKNTAVILLIWRNPESLVFNGYEFALFWTLARDRNTGLGRFEVAGLTEELSEQLLVILWLYEWIG